MSVTMESQTSPIGQEFAQTLLAKDWRHLESLLGNVIDFRGLTPGRSWEASSSKELIDAVFTQWFEPSDDIYQILSITNDAINQRQRVVYRFRVRNPQDDYVCEQTAYFDEVEGKIIKLSILCTGFLPSN
jgi:hypothetical protein